MTLKVLPNLLDKNDHAKLVEFVNKNRSNLAMEWEDSTKRWHTSGVNFFDDVHRALAPYVARILNKNVEPTFSFLSCYTDAGVLPLHIDNEMCEINLDLVLQQELPGVWPLYVSQEIDFEGALPISSNLERMSKPEDVTKLMDSLEFTTVEMKPGDAVLFDGATRWHYRDVSNVGSMDIALFHFTVL